MKVRTTSGGIVEMRLKDLVGRKVKVMRELVNGYIRIPEGAVGKVTGWWQSGVSLEMPRCSKCGIVPRISKVPLRTVELIAPSRDE